MKGKRVESTVCRRLPIAPFGITIRPETALHQTPYPRHAPHSPSPRQSAPFIPVYLREPPDPGSSLLEVTVEK